MILTHSPTLHQKQVSGFAQTLAKARRMLTEQIDTHAGLAEVFDLGKLAPKKAKSYIAGR